VKDIHQERLLILDFGYFSPKGLILSGGPESTIGTDAPVIPAVVFELEIPVLGICYGMQAMAMYFGGDVKNTGVSEFGQAVVQSLEDNPLLDVFAKVGESASVWMSHGDRVEQLPTGFSCIAASDNAPIAAMADTARHYYGVQFHPEVTHTSGGTSLLSNFAISICGCAGDWTSGNIISDAVTRIREQVGADQVLLALSGGVDSSVVALLLHKAIGSQLQCVFVDNGLLRLGIDEPEQKRKIIGNEFIAVFEEEARKLTSAKWLAQGTIYPDVIESAGVAGGKAHVIKSHHNVGGLPDDMQFSLIEPLRELFKDEVRRIGVELGLSQTMVERHPFPGPGLGVRILGEVSEEAADILRRADAIYMAELHANDLYRSVSQAFAVFLPVKSVGVTGDGRRYGYVVALRAVETIDFMTAHATQFPPDFLDAVASRILNEVPEIARVVYDISSKPPGTIEWE